LRIKIAVLAVVIAASFAYLIHWIDEKDGMTAQGPSGTREETRLSGTPNAGGTNGALPASGHIGAVAPQSSGSGSGATPSPSEPGNAATSPSSGTAGDEPAGEGKPGTHDGAAGTAGEGAGQVHMSFVGDVIFAGKVEGILMENGFDHPYKEVRGLLERADITVANLETPVTTRGTAQQKEYIYRSKPEALPHFKQAGFDLVTLANNHIMDYGEQGLLDTFRHLENNGIPWVGAGSNADEAYRHASIEHDGMKIAFLGFSRVLPTPDWFAGKNKPGVAESYSTKLPLEAIRKAREEADLVVVLAHWGQERKDQPVKEQVDLAHQYIDAGADLVVGSHPHVLQGFEQYKGKWIAYSLGNFIFTTNEVPATWETVVMDARCSRNRECSIELSPIKTMWAQPVPMSEEKGQELFRKLTRISVNAEVDKEGRVSAVSGGRKASGEQDSKANASSDEKERAPSTGKAKVPADEKEKTSSTEKAKVPTNERAKTSLEEKQKAAEDKQKNAPE